MALAQVTHLRDRGASDRTDERGTSVRSVRCEEVQDLGSLVLRRSGVCSRRHSTSAGIASTGGTCTRPASSRRRLPSRRRPVHAAGWASRSQVAGPMPCRLSSLLRMRWFAVLSCRSTPTCVRRSFPTAGPTGSRLERLIGAADVVRLSRDDLPWLDPAEPAATAGRWLAAGAALVVVTSGREGATAYHRSREVSVPAEPVELVDTIGDAFNAGLLAWLYEAGRLRRDGIESLGSGSSPRRCPCGPSSCVDLRASRGRSTSPRPARGHAPIERRPAGSRVTGTGSMSSPAKVPSGPWRRVAR